MVSMVFLKNWKRDRGNKIYVNYLQNLTSPELINEAFDVVDKYQHCPSNDFQLLHQAKHIFKELEQRISKDTPHLKNNLELLTKNLEKKIAKAITLQGIS